MNLAKLKLLAPSIADLPDATLTAYLDAAWAFFNDFWTLTFNLAAAPDNVALALSYFVVNSYKEIETTGTTIDQVVQQQGQLIGEKLGDYEYRLAPPITSVQKTNTVAGDENYIKTIFRLMWKYRVRYLSQEPPSVYF